jgi:hypothetical protein
MHPETRLLGTVLLVASLGAAACSSADTTVAADDAAPSARGGSAGSAVGGSAGVGGATATAGASGSGGTAGASGSGGTAGAGGIGAAAGSSGAGGSSVAPDASVPPNDATLPAGAGWASIPSTKLAQVCACTHGFDAICANSQCGGIFAWSSGAMDTKRNRLIVWGGGHGDYSGNELYAFSLDDLTMRRLTDPAPPPTASCVDATPDGTQPVSRHTYDGLA